MSERQQLLELFLSACDYSELPIDFSGGKGTQPPGLTCYCSKYAGDS